MSDAERVAAAFGSMFHSTPFTVDDFETLEGYFEWFAAWLDIAVGLFLGAIGYDPALMMEAWSIFYS